MRQDCPNEKTLSDYLDQALSISRMKGVQYHLEICRECRRKLADLGSAYDRMDQMICDLPEVAPSSGFDERFWRKVAQLEKQRNRPTWMERFFFTWRPLLAAGAAAALVTMFVVFRPSYSDFSREEIFIADHMEMLKDLELIERLDLLENWEVIQAMKGRG